MSGHLSILTAASILYFVYEKGENEMEMTQVLMTQ